jgi:hypothetical protein
MMVASNGIHCVALRMVRRVMSIRSSLDSTKVRKNVEHFVEGKKKSSLKTPHRFFDFFRLVSCFLGERAGVTMMWFDHTYP